jgi:hypothetical protein
MQSRYSKGIYLITSSIINTTYIIIFITTIHLSVSFISIITNIFSFQLFIFSFISGWIQKEGDQIAKQAISSLKAALTNQVKYIEILFDPVPNLGENKTNNISSSNI